MRRSLSLALALVATVLLAVGLVAGEGLALVYLSLACSLLAFTVLLRSLRRDPPTSSMGPASPPRPGA